MIIKNDWKNKKNGKMFKFGLTLFLFSISFGCAGEVNLKSNVMFFNYLNLKEQENLIEQILVLIDDTNFVEDKVKIRKCYEENWNEYFLRYFGDVEIGSVLVNCLIREGLVE